MSVEAERFGTLIIGASQAGVQLASSLRELGYEDRIVIAGAEPYAPYQRPPLSKDFLQGDLEVDSLLYRSADFFEKNGIELALDDRVTGIATKPDGSGTATTASGRVLPFDKLALTVGARPRRLPIEGAHLDGIVYLRDAADALSLKRALTAGERLVVIGGGFIGLEAAASAKKLGKQVTVLEVAPRLIGRAVGEVTSEFFLQAHRKRGLEIVLGARIVRLIGNDAGSVSGVELADGTVIPADVVLIGIGVVPRTELAEMLGLECDNGVVVDEFSLASDGTTVVAGDVANMPCPFPRSAGPERIRLESVNNAVEQARNAAATITGSPLAYRIVPWFWSNQGDIKLQMAGLSTGFDETVIRGDLGAEKFSVLYFHGGELIAADCINSPVDFMGVKSGLAKGLTVAIDRAADTTMPLKALMAESVVLPSH